MGLRQCRARTSTVDYDGEWEWAQQDGCSFRAVGVRAAASHEFMVHSERAPWPTDRFGEVPSPDLWTEAGS